MSTSATFITDPAELRAIQTATHTRSKRMARVRAAEALRAVALPDLASAIDNQAPVAIDDARLALTRMLRDNADRAGRTIAPLRTALGAVGEAWAWDLTDV